MILFRIVRRRQLHYRLKSCKFRTIVALQTLIGKNRQALTPRPDSVDGACSVIKVDAARDGTNKTWIFCIFEDAMDDVFRICLPLE